MLWAKGTPSTASPGCRAPSSGGGRMLQPRDPCTPPPGMATYTDKLFKLRNGRWEDLLSDEVNRAVASRFAGRSVACVDRTVSRQRTAGGGHLRSLPTLPCGVLGDLSPRRDTSPIPPPARAGGAPQQPMAVRTGSPLAVGTAGACPRGCRQLINVPVKVIYVPVTCSFFFLLPQRFSFFQTIITKSGSSCCTGQGGQWGCRGPGVVGCPKPGDRRSPGDNGARPHSWGAFHHGLCRALAQHTIVVPGPMQL